jgi:diacylglycerol kinase family enzyme
MRALLLVNPKATSTNHRTRDVLIRALGAAVDLSVEETGYRGHAAILSATAHAKGFDAVAVLGGDGTINEAVNGLLNGHNGFHQQETRATARRREPRDRRGAQDRSGTPGGQESTGAHQAGNGHGARDRPALIVIPGGSANVFARALGLPNDPVEATGAVLEALRAGRRRTISLGQAVWHDEVLPATLERAVTPGTTPETAVTPGIALGTTGTSGSASENAATLGTGATAGTGAVPSPATSGAASSYAEDGAALGTAMSASLHGSRYFTFCAGLGYDAEVVRAVEGMRSAGYKASPRLYVNTAIRHFFMTDRRHPAMRLERPHQMEEKNIFMAIVSNTAPWTYIGSRPVNPTPWAGFETGLDLIGLQRMGLPSVLRLIRQILGERVGLPAGKHLVHAHDEAELTLCASRPVAFQLDGDYLGEHERVLFRSIPNALQVLV